LLASVPVAITVEPVRIAACYADGFLVGRDVGTVQVASARQTGAVAGFAASSPSTRRWRVMPMVGYWCRTRDSAVSGARRAGLRSAASGGVVGAILGRASAELRSANRPRPA